jgi:hypothetical protein
MEVGFGKRKAEEMMRIARDLSDADVLSSSPEDHLTARRVADDVGCYVQKVAKFGEKLEREKIIGREKGVLGINGTENRVKLTRCCEFGPKTLLGDILQSIGRIAKGSKLAPHDRIWNRESISSQEIDVFED